MSQGANINMTSVGDNGGNAGGNSNENRGGNGGAPGGWPVCGQCRCRHRPGVPCWELCPRCNIRHHRRSACPTPFAQQQQMTALQQQNAQMAAEMQQMRMAMQASSAHAAAYGYGAPPLPSPSPFPFYPWQPQQVMPPMGMGLYPYQGAQYPPSLPPPSPFGGFAVGAPQGMPSDAFNWTGGVPRKGGLPWNNRDRGNKRRDKKIDGKDVKKEEKKKVVDVLAAEPSGVQKPGKNHAKNAKRREKLKARKEKEKEEKRAHDALTSQANPEFVRLLEEPVHENVGNVQAGHVETAPVRDELSRIDAQSLIDQAIETPVGFQFPDDRARVERLANELEYFGQYRILGLSESAAANQTTILWEASLIDLSNENVSLAATAQARPESEEEL